MSALEHLACALTQCGFDARSWKGERLYLSGYGRDIKAHLTPSETCGPLPADGWRLTVTSSWRAVRYNALRCKGVKHAILSDLFTAGLLSAPPPPRWQDVELDGPLSRRPVVKRFEPTAAMQSLVIWPERRTRDPYASLRAVHDEH